MLSSRSLLFSGGRLSTRLIKRHRLCAGDILVRTERTIRIAIDPALVCGDTDLILCPVNAISVNFEDVSVFLSSKRAAIAANSARVIGAFDANVPSL